LDEPELHLSGDALVPDLSGWRRERMPVLPEVIAFEPAPDWACKVLCLRLRRSIARGSFPSMRERVEHSWLVDPALKTPETPRLEGAVFFAE
jgi:hypothetical protein